jgi:hypothetical protein
MAPRRETTHADDDDLRSTRSPAVVGARRSTGTVAAAFQLPADPRESVVQLIDAASFQHVVAGRTIDGDR